MKIFFIALGLGLAAVSYAGASNTAVAACAIGQHAAGIPDAQKVWPSQTRYGNLTNAYNNGSCTITTLIHQSGAPCLNGRTNNHIQVTTNQYTYHVFGYYEVVNGNNYRCATR